jgi:hypothetical protein
MAGSFETNKLAGVLETLTVPVALSLLVTCAMLDVCSSWRGLGVCRAFRTRT